MVKKNRRVQSYESFPSDDESDTSEWSNGSGGSITSTIDIDTVLEALPNLSEKSARVRTEAMQKVLASLLHYSNIDELIDQAETIMYDVSKIIKSSKASAEERCIACRVAALSVLVFQGELNNLPLSERLCEDVIPTIRDASNPSAVIAYAIETLGWASVVSVNSDPESPAHPQKVLDMLLDIVNNKPQKQSPDVITQALHSIGLLSCHNLKAGPSHIFSGILEKLLGLGNADITIATAEVVGMFSDEVNLNRTIDLLYDLQNSTNKTHSKTQRKAQRIGVRNVLTSLEEDQPPTSSCIVNGRKVEFQGWWFVTTYESFKQLAGGTGLSSHLTNNALLREMLEVNVALNSPRSSSAIKKDKRAAKFLSAVAEKERDIQNAKVRRKFGDVHNGEE